MLPSVRVELEPDSWRFLGRLGDVHNIKVAWASQQAKRRREKIGRGTWEQANVGDLGRLFDDEAFIGRPLLEYALKNCIVALKEE